MAETEYTEFIMNSKKYPVIIPTTTKDYKRVKRDLKAILEYLPAKEIVFIGPDTLKEPVMDDACSAGISDRVRYINENQLISFDELTELMRGRLAADGYEMAANSKPGWYYQQFLKMTFSGICEEDYYMSWDADTIPLRPVRMFDDEDRPYFDLKAEYNPGYFMTLKNLLGLDKINKKSFIAEHMIFSRQRMSELIGEIEALPIRGDRYYEKIFYSLDLGNLKKGFSEFETYGSWMSVRHPGEYAFREWRSVRNTGLFVKPEAFSDEDKAYLAKDYDAATFESYHEYSPQLAEIFHNPEYRAEVSAREFYQMLIDEGVFGTAKDGGIAAEGGAIYPV